jgi:hypothetical protein
MVSLQWWVPQRRVEYRRCWALCGLRAHGGVRTSVLDEMVASDDSIRKDAGTEGNSLALGNVGLIDLIFTLR